MTDQARVCPQCVQSDSTTSLTALAATAPASPTSPLDARLAKPVGPRGQGGYLGCATLFFSAAVNTGVGAIVAVLAHVLGGGDASGLNQQAIFLGIAVFMFGFIGLFAYFAYRQAASDHDLKQKMIAWHIAKKRWEQLVYCQRCDGVFVPGQAALTPSAGIQAMLQAQTAEARQVFDEPRRTAA